ncbi:MAG: hypothetical protein JO247_11795, partial [Chloroflexi bacterium]|nr:hypothetical protein [Chloroflexota bacterium]
ELEAAALAGAEAAGLADTATDAEAGAAALAGAAEDGGAEDGGAEDGAAVPPHAARMAIPAVEANRRRAERRV